MPRKHLSPYHFGIGRLPLDWLREYVLTDHTALFQESDLTLVPYKHEQSTEKKRAYVRTLRRTVRRLELLGFSLSECESRFERLPKSLVDYYAEPLPYDDFSDIIRSVDIMALPRFPFHTLDYPSDHIVRDIFASPEFSKLGKSLNVNWYQQVLENIEPEIVLRLLAENPANLDHGIVWRHADDEDYCDCDWIVGPPSRRILIVTEGSSDSAILSTALPIVAADVSDFFDFVDMSKNYPFTGTGSIVNFCKGLARINVQNSILVVLDNDAAGWEARRKIEDLDRPSSMKVTTLPDLEFFRSVRTLGPTGVHEFDVNGCAVAVECFLDLSHDTDISIRWSSYVESVDRYQGALVNKTSIAKRFFDQHRKRNYNLENLKLLWDHLISKCCGST